MYSSGHKVEAPLDHDLDVVLTQVALHDPSRPVWPACWAQRPGPDETATPNYIHKLPIHRHRAALLVSSRVQAMRQCLSGEALWYFGVALGFVASAKAEAQVETLWLTIRVIHRYFGPKLAEFGQDGPHLVTLQVPIEVMW